MSKARFNRGRQTRSLVLLPGCARRAGRSRPACLRQHDVCTAYWSGVLHSQSSRRDVEVIMCGFEHENFSTPGCTTFGSTPQLIGDLSGDPGRLWAGSHGDLQPRPNAAMRIAHIQKHGETRIVALAEPQPAREASDRLRFADLDVLILRRSGDDSLSGFGEIGQPEHEILIAQTRAAEAAVGEPPEQGFESLLQVWPHPVRKVPARDDELVQRLRREMRGKQAIEADHVCFAIHVDKENRGESTQPATRNRHPATSNRPDRSATMQCIGPGCRALSRAASVFETDGKQALPGRMRAPAKPACTVRDDTVQRAAHAASPAIPSTSCGTSSSSFSRFRSAISSSSRVARACSRTSFSRSDSTTAASAISNVTRAAARRPNPNASVSPTSPAGSARTLSGRTISAFWPSMIALYSVAARLADSASASFADTPSSALRMARAARIAATARAPASISARSSAARRAIWAAFSSTPSLFHGEIVVAVNAVLTSLSRSFSAALMRSATLCQRVSVNVYCMIVLLASCARASAPPQMQMAMRADCPKHKAQDGPDRAARPARRNPVSGRLGALHGQRTESKPLPWRARSCTAHVMSYVQRLH